MSSSRVFNYESFSNENLKSWYTGEGMTYLYNGDQTQYTENFWNTVNMYQLPGTTIDTREKTANGPEGYGRAYLSSKDWVGGASVANKYGTAGMWLDAYGASLEAKKSRFMFDNEIVALGAQINSTDEINIETIIDNRKLNENADNVLTVDAVNKSSDLGWTENMEGVSWAHLQGNVVGADIGYYFPNKADVNGLREQRTGSWYDVNKTASKTPETASYMNLWINHGKNPINNAYSYVIMPNMTAEETKNYSSNADIKIVKNDGTAQAVRDNKANLFGINFWEQGEVEYIKTDNPAAVMADESDNELKLGISDPTQKQGKIIIELNTRNLVLKSKDSTINVLKSGETTQIEVDVQNAYGKTHNITFVNIKVASIAMDSTKVEMIKHRTLKLNAAVLPEDAADKRIKWTSSNSDIAEVDENGVVTAKKKGQATITAITLDQNKTATSEITVYDNENRMSFSQIIDSLLRR